MRNRSLWSIPIRVEEPSGWDRTDEPVTFGVPIAAGWLSDPREARLYAGAQPVPVQTEVLRWWPDGSVQWLLLDFQVSVRARATLQLELRRRSARADEEATHTAALQVSDTDKIVEVVHGATRFLVGGSSLLRASTDGDGGRPFGLVVDLQIQSADDEEPWLVPEWQQMEIEARGPLRATCRGLGAVRSRSASDSLEVEWRCSLYAGKDLVRMDLTLRNPRAASHAGGLWDLGDPGSVHFASLSVQVAVDDEELHEAQYVVGPDSPVHRAHSTSLEIYQDSSGGENWQSAVHVNRTGSIPHRHRGYRLLDGDDESTGLRATPTIEGRYERGFVRGSIREFWQNFPSSLSAAPAGLCFGLFPERFGDSFELQGGEQKTQTLYLEMGSISQPESLRWVHDPLQIWGTPEQYEDSAVFYDFSASGRDRDPRFREIVEAAVSGDHTFEDRIETADEYGWRNFGDLYADHEETYYRGSAPLVSHFNNQYDLILGFHRQGLKHGDSRWYRLMDRLARHVMDIDLYHTELDKTAYNGGLFWHTAHYLHAGRATHRTYSRFAQPGEVVDRHFGGGPANEHNYSTGLLYYYFRTGESMARDSVLSLANWVLGMEDGTRTVFRFVDRGDTGLSSKTRSMDFHGPGRGAGNSINALVDAFVLTGDRKYLDQAEKLIRRCIHPELDPSLQQLDEPEERWSYVVFFQILGRYLELKLEMGELDSMYEYTRSSLVRYSTWALENEYPYLERSDRLEFPTETWPAQDMRKCSLLVLGARYGPKDLRQEFLERARYFFDRSLDQLAEFETRHCVRPIAILLACGDSRALFDPEALAPAPAGEDWRKLGGPVEFVPQKAKVRKKLIQWTISAGVAVVLLAAVLAWLW